MGGSLSQMAGAAGLWQCRQGFIADSVRDSRAGRAPTGEWCGWGGVGADLIREPRRIVRLSRTRSAPTGDAIPHGEL
ncbi:hypothetical protein PCLA_02f0726 [Pseudomonas citronellolis]|nr:hypothetical protein PCLA_02f0726 [Pseudomonas citronellolis]